jgi:hypothetical protein
MSLVRTREWVKDLPDGFTIFNRLNTSKGEVVSFAVVLLRDAECVTRYDSAHGFVHRDVIGRKNASPPYKEEYATLTLEEGFNYADKDLSANYDKYYAYYQSH